MKTSGIYRIINLINLKFYIGSAKNIHLRWNRHLNALNKNIHENSHLQRSWKKYGRKNFIIELIEEVLPVKDLLFEREQFYLDTLKPWNKNIGYNIGKNACGGDNLTCNKNRTKIINKIKKSMIERYKNMTDEQLKKISDNFIGNKNPNWKGGISSPLCPKCGNTMMSTSKSCMNCVNRCGKNNSFYGKKHTKKTLEKIRDKNKGRLPPNERSVIIDGIIYKSVASAARKLKVCNATIIFRIKSKYWDYKYYTATSPLIAGCDL